MESLSFLQGRNKNAPKFVLQTRVKFVARKRYYFPGEKSRGKIREKKVVNNPQKIFLDYRSPFLLDNALLDWRGNFRKGKIDGTDGVSIAGDFFSAFRDGFQLRISQGARGS